MFVALSMQHFQNNYHIHTWGTIRYPNASGASLQSRIRKCVLHFLNLDLNLL